MWTYESELIHYGVLGMKWGVRRYQNPDGTWKDAGNKRRTADGVKPGQKTSTRPSGKSAKSSNNKPSTKPTVTKKPVTNKNSNHFKETMSRYNNIEKEHKNKRSVIEKERDAEFERLIKKEFGMGSQDVIRSGKLNKRSKSDKYDKIHEKIYGSMWDGSGGYKRDVLDKIDADYNKRKQDIIDSHVDNMIKRGVKPHINNLGTKKTYDPEHGDYYDFDKEWLMNHIDKSNRYTIDWKTGEIKPKKK